MADQTTCERIICGAINQAEAGMPLLLDCAQSGYVGAQPCTADMCKPWLSEIEHNMGGPCPGTTQQSSSLMVSDIPEPLPDYIVMNDQPQLETKPAAPSGITPATLLTPLPSITQPHTLPNIDQQGVGYGSGPSVWCYLNTMIADNPMFAAAAVVGVYLLMSKKGR